MTEPRPDETDEEYNARYAAEVEAEAEAERQRREAAGEEE